MLGVAGAAALGGAVAFAVLRPASPTSAASNDVAELRAELDALKQQVARRDVRAPRASAPQVEQHARPEREPGEPRSLDEVEPVSAAAVTPTAEPIDQQFTKQTKDAAFARETEPKLRTLVTKLFTDAAIERAECRETVCELAFRTATPQAGMAVMRTSGKVIEGVVGSTVSPGTPTPGDGRAAYVARFEFADDAE